MTLPDIGNSLCAINVVYIYLYINDTIMMEYVCYWRSEK